MSLEPIAGDARRRVIRSVRLRVALATAAVLGAVWLALVGQLEAGDDPALGDGPSNGGASPATETTSATETTEETETPAKTNTTPNTETTPKAKTETTKKETTTTESEPEPVTTSQS